MIGMTKFLQNQKTLADKCLAGIAKSVLGAAGIFVLAFVIAPATFNTNDGVSWQTAEAGNGNGGGNGGGNSGGNGGAHGKGKNKGAPTSESGDDQNLLFLPLKEAITIAQFTTRISRRYPADEVTTFSDTHQSISFFSELQGMSGKKINHRWFYRGEVIFEATFEIRADYWRVWSTQVLPENMPGEWNAEIVDEEGKVLAVRHLNYAPESATLAATK